MSIDANNNHWLKRIQNTVWRLARVPERSVSLPSEVKISAHSRVRQAAANRVSATLRQLRVDHGYSYEQQRDMTGLSLQVLYDIEFKKRRLTVHELGLLAQCYELDASDILGVDLE